MSDFRTDRSIIALRLLLGMVCTSSMAGATTNGLLLQTSVGGTHALAPDFLTSYWKHAIHINASVGAHVVDGINGIIAFTHHTFDYDENRIIPSGQHATANEMMLSLQNFADTEWLDALLPFYSFGVGVTVVSTPPVHRPEIDPHYGARPGDVLELQHHQSGVSMGVGVGIMSMTNYDTGFFAELVTRTTFLAHQSFTYIAGRVGVSFVL